MRSQGLPWSCTYIVQYYVQYSTMTTTSGWAENGTALCGRGTRRGDLIGGTLVADYNRSLTQHRLGQVGYQNWEPCVNVL